MLIFFKAILISLGTFSLFFGVMGIFVPGLPTTPFLLLTAGLYLRSSDNLYKKLTTNKLIGQYISDFNTNKGMTKKSKIYVICTMWSMITLSGLIFIRTPEARLLLLITGFAGTLVMGFLIPTVINSK
ncbi:MAG: YbaN family protein [Bacteroidales bacterium]|jgi:hypothetical protein|nr:YbaN family protein [Bacteroidales bacterium]